MFDLCIIGGGINGAGIARDAAGRGLKTILIEKRDLAEATSSASTKLIHGGLRYLEHYEFSLVRHSLIEREKLLNIAPHIIWPMDFILPHDKNLRPYWLIRLGLLLYDNLGGRSRLKRSGGVKLTGAPLKASYQKGLRYQDCWVEDSRLVVLNAMDAKARGAEIITQNGCKAIQRHEDHWEITLDDGRIISAKKIVNAAGPWVDALLRDNALKTEHTPDIRMVKGSHIIIPRLYEGAHSYILQQPDKRIVFAIPYEHHFTLIGTTDAPYEGDPYEVSINVQERDYLCDAVNRSFNKQIKPADIISTYSGVRPLLDDGDDDASAVTRDYRLVYDHTHGPALLSVFGGKITTYRHLAEEALDIITGNKNHWTQSAALPGGDIDDFEAFLQGCYSTYSHFPQTLVRRLARAYGTKIEQIAGGDMGQHYGDDFYAAELRYLVEHEFALSIEDVLWRRSKLGLHISEQTIAKAQRDMSVMMQEK